VDEFVSPALQSARRGVQLIKRLLTFSRQTPLEPQSVDIGTLIGSLTRLVRRSLPESISLSSETPSALYAQVDPGQLESALLNFALNARDAMPDGGRLHIAARRAELQEDAASFDLMPGAYALIEVEDNGCGMDEATLARVFEPFFTTKRLGLGSGLGLAMAHGFAKQSGGGVLIRSKAGQGTTVMLALPLATPPDDTDNAAEDAPAQADGTLVLLAEDDPEVRRIVRQQLRELGHTVIEAENGVQALELIEHVPDIAIVLSDVIMPGGISGRDVANAVRQDHPRLRMVLMSGYTNDSDSNSESSEDVILLSKPFTRQELARALQRTQREAT